jgi:hypothetical protein
MAVAKSWDHLVSAATAKGVVIAKGVQGIATVKTIEGEVLFSWRNSVMRDTSEQEFNEMVDKMLKVV